MLSGKLSLLLLLTVASSSDSEDVTCPFLMSLSFSCLYAIHGHGFSIDFMKVQEES